MAVPVDAAVELAGRIVAGDLSVDEARIAVALLDDGTDEPETPESRGRLDALVGDLLRERAERGRDDGR